MYLGKIVETGPINDVLENPRHPYTQALIDAISEPNPDNLHRKKEIRIKDPPDTDEFEGCRFKPRCIYAIEKCSKEPDLEKVADNHYSACYVKLD